ncbi:hypothetical protein K492DRAFT_204973 [Lichtheimia hyalospora FSU 10163]|nr:hypothetical protein K492DRAFT_204973 [Lichtheimia hyalospora FSU 10163]
MDTSPNIPLKRSHSYYTSNTQRRFDQSRGSRQPAQVEKSSTDVSDRGDRSTLKPASSERITTNPRIKALSSINTSSSLSQRNKNDSSSSRSPSTSASTTPTPEQLSFEWQGCLEPPDTAGGITTMNVHIQSIAGRAPHASRVKELLNRLSTNKEMPSIQIRSFLALNILQRFFSQSASIMMMSASSIDTVKFAKFRSFLTINLMAGLILRPSRPSGVLAIVPHSEAMVKGWRLKNVWLPHNMLVIYLPSIPPEPPLLKGYLNLDVFSNTTPGQSFDWQTITLALKFPVELLEQIKRDTLIVICGRSKWATELREAYQVFKSKKISQSNQKVILLDRYQDCRFQRNLSVWKQACLQPTFWEFGIPDLDTPKMQPVKRIFPQYTGGFITTNMQNILEKPSILASIADATRRLNLNPANGEWKFVLKDDILDRLCRRMDSMNATQIRIALLHLKAILVCNECELVHDWAEATQDGVDPTQSDDSATSLMEQLLRQYCYTHQNFVIVNDIGSGNPKRLKVIEEIPSQDLYKSFSMEPSG